MGRARDAGPGPGAAKPAAADGPPTNPGRSPNDTSCGICAKPVVVDQEQHIAGHCTACGKVPYHTCCVQGHLEKTLRPIIREGGHSIKAWEKVAHKIKQRPQDLFAYNGGAQKLAVRCPACHNGSIQAADVEKPVRKVVAVPSEPMPRPRAPPPPPHTKKAPARRPPPQPGGGRAPARQGSHQNSNGGAPRRAPGRPVELQMCPETEECGECYMYRCPYCHSAEELAQRERRWEEATAARARQRREQELAAFRAQAAAAADEAAAAAAAAAEHEAQRAARARLRADLVAREEAALPLSDATLGLLKRHKQVLCVAALTDVGFGGEAAARAARAAGCEPAAAAALLMEGGALVAEATPASVIREAHELLAAAAALGVAPPAAEAALVVCGGDWEQARRELQAHVQADRALEAARQAEAAGQAPAAAAALPTDQPAADAIRAWCPDGAASPKPVGPAPLHPAPASPAPAPGPGLASGFPAGLTSAKAALAGWQPVPAPAPAAAEPAWLPPQMHRQAPADEEIDGLMHMLGIA